MGKLVIVLWMFDDYLMMLGSVVGVFFESEIQYCLVCVNLCGGGCYILCFVE